MRPSRWDCAERLIGRRLLARESQGLENGIVEGGPHLAYLFVGPSGVHAIREQDDE